MRGSLASKLFAITPTVGIIVASIVLQVSAPRMALASGTTITEFSLPSTNSVPLTITAGPDGNLWFAEGATRIGRITVDGTISEFATPTPSRPTGITAAPDGNLWFTEAYEDKIGRVTPTGAITEFAVPTRSSYLDNIAAGSDGNLWFTETYGNKIGKITTSGVVTEYPLPTTNSRPTAITNGPDGNLWFTEALYGNRIGKITTGGSISEFVLPTNCSSGANGCVPDGITVGPDGNLWFTELYGNQVGKITTSGAFTEYRIPTADSQPEGIVSGPDGNLWATESNANNLLTITPAGTITEVPIPTSGSGAMGITRGPDGNVWFTEYFGNKIGRVNLSAPSHFYVTAIKDYGLLSHPAGMVGRFGIYQPNVPTQANAYSIAQLAAINGLDAIEVGWVVYPASAPQGGYGDKRPHLFVFTRHTGHSCNLFRDSSTGTWMCYDENGNRATSDFVAQPNLSVRPGDPLKPTNTPQQFFVAHTDSKWYVGFKGTLIGYFPDSHWGGAFTSVAESQWYGEVVSPNSLPIEQMGNGVCGSQSGSAMINNIKKITSFTVTTPTTYKSQTVSVTPTISETRSSSYNHGHNFMAKDGYTFTYGGPGVNGVCQ